MLCFHAVAVRAYHGTSSGSEQEGWDAVAARAVNALGTGGALEAAADAILGMQQHTISCTVAVVIY